MTVRVAVSVDVSVWVAQMGETLTVVSSRLFQVRMTRVCTGDSLPRWQPEKIYRRGPVAGVPVEINGVLQLMNFIDY